MEDPHSAADTGTQQRRRRPRSKKPSAEASDRVEQPSVQPPPGAGNDATAAQPPPPPKQRQQRPRKPRQPSGGGPKPSATPSSQGEAHTGPSTLSIAAQDFQPSHDVPPGLAQLSAHAARLHQQGISPTAAAAAAAAVAAPPRKPRNRKKKPAAASSGAAAREETAAAASDNAAADGAPLCLLCCEPMQLASFGCCGHTVACGPCALRLRKCYGRTDCPLCKSELPELVIAPWRHGLPDFGFFAEFSEFSARSRPGELGPGSVWADRWLPGQRGASSRLLHDLVRSTGLACAVCDPDGRYPFNRANRLEAHLKECHGQAVCGMCLHEGRMFPLDCPLYGSEAELSAHAAAAHPRCEFCRGRAFFDGDALWAHMMDRHLRCQLCSPGPGGAEPWFADADSLRQHLHQGHFACEDPDCDACLVAFNTAEELRRHTTERHSSRMPRWNASTARPLQLDIQFVRRPGEGDPTRRGAVESRSGRRRRGDADQQTNGGEQPRRSGHAGFELETEGGLGVIDDDLGLMFEAYGGLSGAGSSFALSDRRSEQRQQQQSREAFPSLADASSSAAAAAQPAAAGRRAPPLIKHTVKCPCGRRVSYPVSEAGQPVPELKCDAVCQLEGRRRALADAFGVDNPELHVSAFDRRPAVWSGALLAAAKQQRAWVEGVEKALGAFVADASTKREVLSPMPKQQRILVHAMAEQYGIASASTGQEPHRSVELFKTPSSRPGLPTRLLSRFAPTVPDEEIAALLRAAQGFPVRFCDVAPTADIHFYLRRWEGQYKVEWHGGSAATVTYDRQEAYQETLDALGGGIRGLFTIDRKWQPKIGVGTGEAPAAANSGRSSSGGGGGGAAGAAWGVGSSGAAGAQQPQLSPWTAAATGTARGGEGVREEAAAVGGAGAGPAVPSGWAVIGAKRAAKPRMVAAAAERSAAGEAALAASEFTALGLEQPENGGGREAAEPRSG